VVYIPGIHSSEATSSSPSTFCTSVYGVSGLTPPWALHPNELLDGAVSGPYRTAFATSWMQVNNPVLHEMLKRHGTEFDFVSCVVLRTEWTTQAGKDLVAQETAKLAKLLGADGAIVTWDAGGNEFMEVIRTVQECERLGIKTVFLTTEDRSAEGVSTMLEPVVEADAMVSAGTIFPIEEIGLGQLPAVDRVIGSPEKLEGSLRNMAVPTGGPLPPPRRYDDHYGINRFTCVDY
jgi:glycine reductase